MGGQAVYILYQNLRHDLVIFDVIYYMRKLKYNVFLNVKSFLSIVELVHLSNESRGYLVLFFTIVLRILTATATATTVLPVRFSPIYHIDHNPS